MEKDHPRGNGERFCEDVPAMAATFKALGDPTRLQIISLLATDTTGTLSVSVLADRLGITQPAVSQHLKVLKAEGLVDSRREGLFMYYSINRERMVQFQGHFGRMYAGIMAKCTKDFVRTMTQHATLNACVVFYSYTGITRGIAEQIRNACGCDLVEVRTQREYSAFSAYTTGVLRSRRGECDAISPGEIDVLRYDLIVIGTPVWAWKPAPAINAAVRALRGCEGKPAVVFVTNCGQPGESLPLLSAALASRGIRVVAAMSLSKEEIDGGASCNDLIQRIVAAYPQTDKPADSADPDLKQGG